MALWLAIDVGNTRTKLALVGWPDASAPTGGARLPSILAVHAVDADAPLDAWLGWPSAAQHAPEPPAEGLRIDAAAVAGVAPARIEALLQLWPNEWPAPSIVRTFHQLPLEVAIEEPETAGIDRLLKAVAVNRIRAPGQPAILVDSGTATTVDLVTAAGAFAGGAILPGLAMSARALHEQTAQLPLIDPAEFEGEPPPALGRSTRPALRSGVFWGQIGAVKELIRRITPAHAPHPPLILVTGGAGGLLAPHLEGEVRLEPGLVLQGLVLAAAKQQPD